ncbi:unnamed protein product [Brassicogethes aeneus]|uniref:Gag-like protein n=1 Tax=Brassicogethes aeneus TaxID=1431903 RepID=A0A9P0BBH6_BRAAE|nr:unnamed protein product [Brassicogethes aeneus]
MIKYDAKCGNDIEKLVLNRKSVLIAKQLQDRAIGLDTPSIEEFTEEEVEDDQMSVASDTSKKRKLNQEEKECINCQEMMNDLNYEKKINKELSQHNTELRENNNFLRTLAIEKSSPVQNKTYSNVVSNNIPKKQNYVQLVIKPKPNYKGDALNIVQKQVYEKTKARVIEINKINNGTIYIKCNSEHDAQDISKTLNNENSDIITVSSRTKDNPQLRITNMVSNADKQELEEDIIQRNQLLVGSVKILHIYKQKNEKYGAITEVSADAYAKIMKTETAFVGYQNCKVYDEYNINRCKKCCGYNHSYKKCQENQNRKKACLKCGAEHTLKEYMIEQMDKKPEIIVCTEAWLKKDITFIDFPEYTQLDNGSMINQNDGVVMYIKSGLQYNSINEQYGELKVVIQT